MILPIAKNGPKGIDSPRTGILLVLAIIVPATTPATDAIKRV
jgi:hypothetical protein